jgi:hypothetical protein
MRERKAWERFLYRIVLLAYFCAADVLCGASLPRVEVLIAALRPALPFPAATADGELPADNSAQSKWFVLWPTEPDATQVVVKANPLHPETQRAGAEAMDRINAAVAAAERKAQAAYDKALEELRRSGTGATIDAITLDDEGVAGERIDAELEMTIDLQPAVSYEIATSEAPAVTAATHGAVWRVHVPANVYRRTSGTDLREHFRPAETRLYFGALPRPEVGRKGNEPLFGVKLADTAGAFAVVLRGNDGLIRHVVANVDWSTLVP